VEVYKMGKRSGKPGPDPKTPLENVVVPPPYRRGGASGKPLVELAKEQAKQTQEWMKEVTES
jgi:hypothetical protein